MKKIVFAVFVMSMFLAQAQNKSSVETRALMREFSKAKSPATMSHRVTDKLAVSSDAHGTWVRIVAKVSPSFNKTSLEQNGIRVTSQVADIVALRVPIQSLPTLDACADILQYSVAHQAVPLCDKARIDTHTDSVHAGIGVPQVFNGEGVIIGITDWGFDYLHPNFNSSAEKRILRAWDQFKLSGPAPEGFDYGTEYKTYDELKAAKCDTSNIYGYHSHGSHVAGICGGRGTKAAGSSDNKYIGQAPKVKFLMGSWLLDEASWLDQVAWMYRVSKEEGKRLVINSSWGMYSFSTLDGTSLLSQAINHYSDSGIVFVTSAGNNAGDNYHLKLQFGQNVAAGDTARSIATYYLDGAGQMLIYWGTPGQQFQSGFALSKGSTIYPGEFFATDANIDYYENYLVIPVDSVRSDTIRYNVMTESCNPFDQRPHVILKVDKNSGYKLHMMCTAPQETEINVWNVNYVKEHESNVGTDFTASTFSGYLNGDDQYGIGEPACAEKSIAVAAHSSGQHSSDGTFYPGPIAYFSSYGPTLDGRNKPEISAPGVNVVSSISSHDNGEYTIVDHTTGGTHSYPYATMSGTSMSGPSVSGIVALMLQANPRLTIDQIREVIFTTATNDEATGPILANDSISIRWGYGKINALKAVNGAIDKLSVDEVVALDVPLSVYPNPSSNRVTVSTGTNLPCHLSVYGTDGRLVAETTACTQASFDVSRWANGIYIVRAQDRSGIRTAKLIVK